MDKKQSRTKHKKEWFNKNETTKNNLLNNKKMTEIKTYRSVSVKK